MEQTTQRTITPDKTHQTNRNRKGNTFERDETTSCFGYTNNSNIHYDTVDIGNTLEYQNIIKATVFVKVIPWSHMELHKCKDDELT